MLYTNDYFLSHFSGFCVNLDHKKGELLIQDGHSLGLVWLSKCTVHFQDNIKAPVMTSADNEFVTIFFIFGQKLVSISCASRQLIYIILSCICMA